MVGGTEGIAGEGEAVDAAERRVGRGAPEFAVGEGGKEYVFDTPEGKKKLGDLFERRSQLVVYHFMFGPDWEEGCPSCSILGDHIDGSVVHLANRDVTLIAASRAPLAKIEAFKKRMGWRFKWASSFGSEFNWDYHVSFTKEAVEKKEMYYNFSGKFFRVMKGRVPASSTRMREGKFFTRIRRTGVGWSS